MRYKCGLLLAGVLTFGLVAQGYAAPAGFTEHKLAGLTIAVPSAWRVAPKEALAQLEKQAKGMKVLLAAEGDSNGFPKFTVMSKNQNAMSQADFEKLDEAGVKSMCDQMGAQMQKTQGTTDFGCKRVKAEKGSALATELTLPQAGMVNVSYLFFQGPKKTTMINAMFKKDESAKLLPVVEEAMKSVKLGK